MTVPQPPAWLPQFGSKFLDSTITCFISFIQFDNSILLFLWCPISEISWDSSLRKCHSNTNLYCHSPCPFLVNSAYSCPYQVNRFSWDFGMFWNKTLFKIKGFPTPPGRWWEEDLNVMRMSTQGTLEIKSTWVNCSPTQPWCLFVHLQACRALG